MPSKYGRFLNFSIDLLQNFHKVNSTQQANFITAQPMKSTTKEAPQVPTIQNDSSIITVKVDDIIKNVQSKDYFLVSPLKIGIIEGFNIRHDYGDIDELANSIEENGVHTALEVFKQKIKKGSVLLDGSICQEDIDGYATIDGHRRREALKILFNRNVIIDRIPVKLTEAKTAEQRLVAMFLSSGKPHTVLEIAELFGKLYFVHKKTIQEIAKQLGIKSTVSVNIGIEMSKAPSYVKELIHNHILSYSLVWNSYDKVFNRDWDKTEEYIKKNVDAATEKVAMEEPSVQEEISQDTQRAEKETTPVNMASGNDMPVIVSPTGMTVNLNDVNLNDEEEKDSSNKKPEGSGRRNNQTQTKKTKPVVSSAVKEKIMQSSPDKIRKEIKRGSSSNNNSSNGKSIQPTISSDENKKMINRIGFLMKKINDNNLPTDNKLYMLLSALSQKEGEYDISHAFNIYNQFIG